MKNVIFWRGRGNFEGNFYLLLKKKNIKIFLRSQIFYSQFFLSLKKINTHKKSVQKIFCKKKKSSWSPLFLNFSEFPLENQKKNFYQSWVRKWLHQRRKYQLWSDQGAGYLENLSAIPVLNICNLLRWCPHG